MRAIAIREIISGLSFLYLRIEGTALGLHLEDRRFYIIIPDDVPGAVFFSDKSVDHGLFGGTLPAALIKIGGVCLRKANVDSESKREQVDRSHDQHYFFLKEEMKSRVK